MNTPNVNIELAAATYLSAKMETIAYHDQGRWVNLIHRSGSACGTSACLAGHIMIFEYGGVKEAFTACKTNDTEWESFVALTTKGDHDPITCEEEADMLHSLEHVFHIMNECEALKAFKDWVQEYSTEEEWAQFEKLTNMDPNTLLRELEYAV